MEGGRRARARPCAVIMQGAVVAGRVLWSKGWWALWSDGVRAVVAPEVRADGPLQVGGQEKVPGGLKWNVDAENRAQRVGAAYAPL